jgi:DNA-binding response OmpR family regulator
MHVIHLEDEYTLRAVLEIGFKAIEPGMTLRQFRSGEEALPYIKEHGSSVDLFIIDLSLPGMLDGLDMAHKIRELTCPGSIILTSGCDVPDADVLRALRCDYVPKPWQLIQLSQKLPRSRQSTSRVTASKRLPATSSRR